MPSLDTGPRETVVTHAHNLEPEKFTEHFRDQGYKVSIDGSDSDEEFPWDGIIVKYMVPSHRAIGDFERPSKRLRTHLKTIMMAGVALRN